MTDIDIDFPTAFDPRSLLPSAIPASIVRNGELTKHPCGFYFQNIPVDPITNLAAIPYAEAADLGFFKVDFLHLSLLDSFVSKSELRRCLNTPPDWTLLRNPAHVEKLFQLKRHSEFIGNVAPTDVETLADCIALIRPSKKHLARQYASSTPAQRQAMRTHLYTKPTDDKNWFKKAHAIAYALTITLQLHLISQGRL